MWQHVHASTVTYRCGLDVQEHVNCRTTLVGVYTLLRRGS